MNPISTLQIFALKAAAILVLCLAIFGVGFHYGSSYVEGKQANNEVVAIKKAADTTVATVVDVNAVAVNYEAKLATQKKESNAQISLLKERLASMPSCPVSADIVQLLDSAASGDVSDDSTLRRSTSSATAPAVSSCAAELELAARNYEEVCRPNADQLIAVQTAYEVVMKRLNDANTEKE